MFCIRQKRGQKCFIPPSAKDSLIQCVRYAGFNPTAAAIAATGPTQLRLLAREGIHLSIYAYEIGKPFKCVNNKRFQSSITLLRFTDDPYFICAPHGQYQADEFLCYVVQWPQHTHITEVWTAQQQQHEELLVLRRLPILKQAPYYLECEPKAIFSIALACPDSSRIIYLSKHTTPIGQLTAATNYMSTAPTDLALEIAHLYENCMAAFGHHPFNHDSLADFLMAQIPMPSQLDSCGVLLPTPIPLYFWNLDPSMQLPLGPLEWAPAPLPYATHSIEFELTEGPNNVLSIVGWKTISYSADYRQSPGAYLVANWFDQLTLQQLFPALFSPKHPAFINDCKRSLMQLLEKRLYHWAMFLSTSKSHDSPTTHLSPRLVAARLD